MMTTKTMDVAEFLGIKPNQELVAVNRRPSASHLTTVQDYLGEVQVLLRDLEGNPRAMFAEGPSHTVLMIIAHSSDPPAQIELWREVMRLRMISQDLVLTLEISDGKRILADRPLRRDTAILAVDDGNSLFHFGAAEVVTNS